MGSRYIEMSPTRKITTESTPAKIGRWMKKWENFMEPGSEPESSWDWIGASD
jgi:hypothetical protein